MHAATGHTNCLFLTLNADLSRYPLHSTTECPSVKKKQLGFLLGKKNPALSKRVPFPAMGCNHSSGHTVINLACFMGGEEPRLHVSA